MLLIRISHLCVQSGSFNPAVFELVEQLKQDFVHEFATPHYRLNILQALFRMKFYDDDIMSMTSQLIKQKKFTNLEQLTTVLYLLAKNRFKSDSNEYLDSAIDLLAKEPKLEFKIAIRNLWNLYALDYHSD